MAKRIIPLILILAIAGYFGYQAWQKKITEKADDRYYGTVEADEVLLSAQVAGRVMELNAEEGRKVKKGDLLARIDETPYAAQLDQARAATATASAQAGVVGASLKGVDTEVNRVEKLLQTGAVPSMQLDSLQTQKSVLNAQGGAIQKQVGQAQATVKLAETQLGFTRIVAPLDATVLRKDVLLGETVFPGSALLVIADLSTLKVEVFVPEPMLSKIRLDQKVEILVDGYAGQPLYGSVAHIADTAEFTPKNVQTRDERVRLIYRIKVRVPNPQGILKIGMPVDARFIEG